METSDLFSQGLAIIKTRYTKKKRKKKECNKSCKQTSYLQSRFFSFLAQNSPKEATDVALNGSKFS
jgi:hypothetical protein